MLLGSIHVVDLLFGFCVVCNITATCFIDGAASAC